MQNKRTILKKALFAAFPRKRAKTAFLRALCRPLYIYNKVGWRCAAPLKHRRAARAEGGKKRRPTAKEKTPLGITTAVVL